MLKHYNFRCPECNDSNTALFNLATYCDEKLFEQVYLPVSILDEAISIDINDVIDNTSHVKYFNANRLREDLLNYLNHEYAEFICSQCKEIEVFSDGLDPSLCESCRKFSSDNGYLCSMCEAYKEHQK